MNKIRQIRGRGFEVDIVDGKPDYVRTDDGYCQTARAFDDKRDGWMLKQLDPNDFAAIRTGRDMEDLVNMVNQLSRRNYELEQDLEMWRRV